MIYKFILLHFHSHQGKKITQTPQKSQRLQTFVMIYAEHEKQK